MPQQHRVLNGSTGPGQQLQQDPSILRQKAPQYFQSLRTLSVRDIAHNLSASSISSFSSIDSPIKAIAWNAVGTRVACAHADRSISIWPVADATGNMGGGSASDQKSSRASSASNADLSMTVVLRSAHDRSIEGISWDPLHPNRLASCSADGAVRIWDTAPHLTNPLSFPSSSQMAGSRVRTITNAVSSPALLATTSTDIDNYVVKYSPCGQFLGIGTRSDQVIIYRVLKEYKIVPVSQSQENQNHNGRRSKNSNQNTRNANQTNNKPRLVISLVKLCSHTEHDEIYDLCWSNTSNIFALSLGNGNIRIFLFDFKEVSELQKVAEVNSIDQTATEDVAMLDVSTDKEGATSSDSKIEASLQVIHTLRGHRTAASCVAFDPKGCYIAVGSNEGIVSLWDISSSDFICFRTFNKPDHAISSLSISHDGVYIAIGVEGASGNTSGSVQTSGPGSSSSNMQNIGDMPVIIGCVESGEYVHSIDYPHFFFASGSSISTHGSSNNLTGLGGGPDALNYSGSLPHSGGGTPNINGIPRSDTIDYGGDHPYPSNSSNSHTNHNLQIARSKGARPLVMWHPLKYYLLYSADMSYSSGSGGSGGSGQPERGGSLPLMILGRF
ncbi:uncharacterized protein SAPINGB_P003934 [Magnusiomyces paraingens]|uniref:Anaphase-promoting complex subunit 4 WD40 domain-containing protein n=1 Tax=Magnusiomyces paraingens TaxID=2606893 RepID=A0A5E8BZC2_9ASCO|nr:uncharacterized protein SAPINGB_P003934 [Saprochaete ingens]VVT54155.1 unnamed protein product [Saprochaete ingens]